MTIISDSIYTNQVVAGVNPNAPLLCNNNVVNALTISIETGVDVDFLENLANPSTAFYAQVKTLDPFYLSTEIPQGKRIDYVGIARHNLPPGAEIKISILVGGIEYDVTNEIQVGNKQVQVIRFNEATPDEVRVNIKGQDEFVNIGVLYVGLSTQMQRNIYVGHTPITMGRNNNRVGGFSNGGQFLGRVLRSRTYKTSVDFQNLTPDWYREVLDPFIGDPEGTPAFWLWRPEKYPDEIAYAWVVGDPKPSNQRSNGMMQINFELEGLV